MNTSEVAGSNRGSIHSVSASVSNTIQGTVSPPAAVRGSSARTVPENALYIGADTKPPASASFCPARTRSPTETTGTAGVPMCWESGYTASPAPVGTNRRMGEDAESDFPSAG